jgi:hypothetical protein
LFKLEFLKPKIKFKRGGQLKRSSSFAKGTASIHFKAVPVSWRFYATTDGPDALFGEIDARAIEVELATSGFCNRELGRRRMNFNGGRLRSNRQLAPSDHFLLWSDVDSL